MAVFWLLIGGLFYTLGCIFFVLDRMPYNHAIWHLFVMGGSISHFFSVILYL
jgi:hemolysin III